MTAAETEMVAWLVRWHLLMSATAFKRDLSDFKTILDFAEQVQSPERLRLLLLLTIVDIRAVGPGVWNGWKRQLLGDLYIAAEEVLRLGHKQKGRRERIEDKQAHLREALGWDEARFAAYADRMPESYWVAEAPDILLANARADRRGGRQRATALDLGQPRRRARGDARHGLCRRIIPACSIASPARSMSRAATSSTRASTPRATAWRSTISSSRIRSAARSTIPSGWCGCASRSRMRSPTGRGWPTGSPPSRCRASAPTPSTSSRWC